MYVMTIDQRRWPTMAAAHRFYNRKNNNKEKSAAAIMLNTHSLSAYIEYYKL